MVWSPARAWVGWCSVCTVRVPLCGGGASNFASPRKQEGGRRAVAATRHCLAPVLPRSAKTSFPEARTTSLRSVVLSRLGPQEFAGPVSAPPARRLVIIRLGNRPVPQLSEGRLRRRNLQGRVQIGTASRWESES